MDNQNTAPILPPNEQLQTTLPMDIKQKLINKSRDLWRKFYSNKKIFLPVSFAFGLVFLTIVIGLFFGQKRQGARILPTPTPTSSNIISPTPGSTETKLDILKNQINNLDVRQRRLQPPNVNFDISF